MSLGIASQKKLFIGNIFRRMLASCKMDGVGKGWNHFFINLWLIYLWDREQISSPLREILSTYFLCLQNSLKFLNQILKLWSKIQKKHFQTPFLKIRNICAYANGGFSLLHTNYEFLDMIGAYSEPCQTSKTEFFAEIVNVWKVLINFAKSFIVDVWYGSEYTSAWYEVEGYIGHTLVTRLFLNTHSPLT